MIAKRLSIHDRVKIANLIGKGYSSSEIAKRLRRGKTTILRDIKRNGGRDKYDYNLAENNANNRLDEAMKKRKRLINHNQHTYFVVLRQRVEFLEKCVEELNQKIKEMEKNI